MKKERKPVFVLVSFDNGLIYNYLLDCVELMLNPVHVESNIQNIDNRSLRSMCVPRCNQKKQLILAQRHVPWWGNAMSWRRGEPEVNAKHWRISKVSVLYRFAKLRWHKLQSSTTWPQFPEFRIFRKLVLSLVSWICENIKNVHWVKKISHTTVFVWNIWNVFYQTFLPLCFLGNVPLELQCQGRQFVHTKTSPLHYNRS